MIRPLSGSTKIVLSAEIIGATAALFFAVIWFRAVAGNCGVVRFYEQLYGIFVLACWLVVTLYGIGFACKGARLKSRLKILGNVLVIVACMGMVLISIKTLEDIRKMKLPAPPPVIQIEPGK
jgi:hypothetical protein